MQGRYRFVLARLAVTVGVLAAVSLMVLGVRSSQLHQIPGAAGPSRIEICGRTFTGPGTSSTAAEVRARLMTRIGSVPTWQGRREVWGQQVTVSGAPGCGTGVFLKTGPDAFLGYALSGGP